MNNKGPDFDSINEQDTKLEEELESVENKEQVDVSSFKDILNQLKRPRNAVIFSCLVLFVLFAIYKVFFSSGSNKFETKPTASSQSIAPSISRRDMMDSGKIDSTADLNLSNITTPNMDTDVKLPELPPLPEIKPQKIEDQQPVKNEALPPPLLDPDANKSTKPNRTISTDQKLPPLFELSGVGPQDSNGISKTAKSDFIFIGSDLEIEAINNQQKPKRITNLQSTIAQGKILEAVLETSINSQIQGPVRAIVSTDVYSEVDSNILIPKGTRLFGGYSDASTTGQVRIGIVWNRLIRPDGISMSLNSFAADQFGRAGVEGDVDRKYAETFQSVALYSLLNLGIASAMNGLLGNNANTYQSTFQNPQGLTTQVNLNPITAASQATITTISDAAKQIVGNSINTRPVITVNQGTLINVIINQDLVLPTYNALTTSYSSISY